MKKIYSSHFKEETGLRKKFSKALINQLIEEVNMAEFVEDEYDLMLYPSGNGWVKTNCLMPNHNDSSPSFGINVEGNFYNCFACGASGNIVNLIQNVEGLNFYETIQKLSVYSGIETETSELGMKQTLKEINLSIDEFLNRSLETNLPGGMSEVRFLFSIAQRIKSFESKVQYNPKHLKWSESIYKAVDDAILINDENKLNIIWKNLNKKIKERLQNG
ncbi:MAG: primase [Bacteroidota bacterium]|jgi:DNA primase